MVALAASLAAHRISSNDDEVVAEEGIQAVGQEWRAATKENVDRLYATDIGEHEFEDVPTGEPVEIRVDSELVQQALSVVRQQAATQRAQACNDLAAIEGTLVFVAHRAFVQVVSGEVVSLVLTAYREKMPEQVQPVNVQVQWLSSGHSAVLWPVMPCAFFPVGSFVSLASNFTSPLQASAYHDLLLHNNGADSNHFSLTRAPAMSLAQFWTSRDMFHRVASNSTRSELPEEYDVRTDPRRKICFPKDGRTVVLDQGSCGSCWVFAAVGAAGDRHCIASPNSMLGSNHEDRFVLSVQQMLSCKHTDGCDGGTGNRAYRYMAANPTTIWRRFKYQARCFEAKGGVVQEWSDYVCKTFDDMDDSNPLKPCPCVAKERRLTEQPPCPAELVDRTELRSGILSGRVITQPHRQQKTHKAAIELFELVGHTELPSPGSLADVYHPTFTYSSQDISTMMQESLHKDGPLYVSYSVHEDFQRFFRQKRTGVYQWDGVAAYSGSHAVVLVGWGQSSALPFWTLRNSWGKDWGDSGHFRMRRGVDECGIETKVYAPSVKAVVRPRNLLLEDAVTTLALQDDAGKKGLFWLFRVQCVDDHRAQADCIALSATILDFKAQQATVAMAEQKKQLRCCCDTTHFKQPPGRCLLVPPQASARFWKGDLVCGKYNFGRGHTQTHHHKSACNDIMQSAETNGLQLQSEVAQGRLQISVDLQLQRWLIGEHRLQVHVKLPTSSADGGITALERKHEFRVRISEDVDIWAKPIPGFTSVDVGLRTARVAVKERSGSYRYKDKRLVQVDAVCSSDCDHVEAVFTDMDTSNHPDGVKAARLHATARTYDVTSLTWQGDCASYRPGNFVLRLKAKLRHSDRELEATEKLTIPDVLGISQLELWQPFAIRDMILELKQHEEIWDPHHHQETVKIPVNSFPVTSADSTVRSMLTNFFSAASFFGGGARKKESERDMSYTTMTRWEGGYTFRDFQEAVLTCSRPCKLVEARLFPRDGETKQASRNGDGIVAMRLDSYTVALRWRVEDYEAGSYTLFVMLGAGPHMAKGEYSVEIPDQFYEAES
eukprot:CAMPEP_0172673188 /NCGR_PEP_ID=MMETSP1074-20121228/11997_1 /TAXON_ID=2916 /ORGANISM="Ceratium fusus, Strain PA161109" /LENGTH=1058 /DNA_ID=CAMNT_0013490457 /DNA_START=26 /DNA_END=3202 /DNA_ORIENTATION=-